MLEIYKRTKGFPKEELYGLTSQIQRSVVSVTSNIAEGASRQHKKDYLNFLYIAKASLSETESLLTISHELDYLSSEEHVFLDKLCQGTARTLYGLIQSVEAEV